MEVRRQDVWGRLQHPQLFIYLWLFGLTNKPSHPKRVCWVGIVQTLQVTHSEWYFWNVLCQVQISYGKVGTVTALCCTLNSGDQHTDGRGRHSNGSVGRCQITFVLSSLRKFSLFFVFSHISPCTQKKVGTVTLCCVGTYFMYFITFLLFFIE